MITRFPRACLHQRQTQTYKYPDTDIHLQNMLYVICYTPKHTHTHAHTHTHTHKHRHRHQHKRVSTSTYGSCLRRRTHMRREYVRVLGLRNKPTYLHSIIPLTAAGMLLMLTSVCGRSMLMAQLTGESRCSCSIAATISFFIQYCCSTKTFARE